MGELRERTLKSIKEKRKKILEGGINSIPSPFKRFTPYFVGIEQATYYLITAYSNGGKSQFTCFYFIFEPLMYLYDNRDKLGNYKYTVLAFPLEETPERIMQRFMSYLLFKLSNGEHVYSPAELRSSNNDKPLPQKVIDILESKEYLDRIDYFEENVKFYQDLNPTGIYKEVKKYMEERGTTFYKEIEVENEVGEKTTRKLFDYYKPNNPDEYVITFIDHISIIDLERGYTLKQSIDKASEYCSKLLRNRYGVSPVIVQQQGTSNESLDAFKQAKTAPSRDNLSDSKYTYKDASVMISLYNPSSHELTSYSGYDLTVFKDNIRFLSIKKNRDGEVDKTCPLLFFGTSSHFEELPKPENKEEMDVVLKKLTSFRDMIKNKQITNLTDLVKEENG